MKIIPIIVILIASLGIMAMFPILRLDAEQVWCQDNSNPFSGTSGCAIIDEMKNGYVLFHGYDTKGKYFEKKYSKSYAFVLKYSLVK